MADGYSKVPCVHFSENYSPVVNNITFCFLLLMVLHFGYSAEIVNIETIFFYRKLEEEIYMECPLGMSNIQIYKFIILNKCIYGFVQAAKQ